MTDDHDRIEESALTRRDSLLRLGGFAALALGAGAVEALDGQDAKAAATGPAAVASGLVTCVLTPEMTEGPYYLDGDKMRRDIREGTTGHAPRPRDHGGRRLDVQADQGRGRRHLALRRGRDVLRLRAGRARTATPSCAASRGRRRTASRRSPLSTPAGTRAGRFTSTSSVSLGGNVLHTGQLFFPESLTDAVYRRAPYNRRPSRDTRNATDSIYRNGGSRSMLKLTKSGTGYVGRITMGVSRS